MSESRRERAFWIGLGILISIGILGGYSALLFAAVL
jgi:hypothetical protein